MVHSIINTNFGKSEVPPWFNEGLAEYYQTFAIEEDQKVKLGLPQGNHLLLLQQNKLIPLETLFKISNAALHQNGDHSRSVFYAEAWALIHYLVQNKKSEGLNKFLTLSMKDVPQEKAFQDAFQITYAQMEKDLKKYVSQSTYQYSMVSFKNKLTFDAEMQTAALSEAESNAYLGDLLYHTNRADAAETYLQKAVQLNPESSAANTTFGMVKIRQRKFDEAKKYLEKAISEDQKNHLAFYNYAYLLSKEDRDEFGYVSSFPADKSKKMRDLLKKAIAVNPNFTESYELLAFVSLVNNDQLDEAAATMQQALKLQPGNQRYAMRVAEIYARQDKFKEAQTIAEKIQKTADEPTIKQQADNLLGQIRQREEITAQNQASRQQYEAMIAEAKRNGNRVVVVDRNAPEKSVSPEEAKRAAAKSELRAVNQSIRKPQPGETLIVGRIEKIDCKGKNVGFTIKTESETFQLTSKDFQSLALTSFVDDATDAQVGCDAANISQIKAVLAYKPQTDLKNSIRGELVAIDFVSNNFRLMNADELKDEPPTLFVEETTRTVAPEQNPDFEQERKRAMMQGIKDAMRKLQPGEKQELGFIEKVECSAKGNFFHLKTATQIFKFSSSAQPLQIMGFTTEIEQLQIGCGLKQVNIPVVFTYKDQPNGKNKTNGELVSLEFMPKSFTLEK